MAFLRLRRVARLFSTATINPKNPRNRPETLAETINGLFNERNLDRLVASFKLSSNSYRFRCRHNIFLSAVGRLSASGRNSSVREILDFQKQFKDDFKRSEGFGIRLISLYGKAKMTDDAKRTFDEMEELLGERRSIKSLNALLTVFVDCEEFNRVSEVLEEAKGSIAPNSISYNILIKALCNKGDLDAALKVLDTMEENSLPPCQVSYNTLLNAFYGNDRFSDAEMIWARMENNKIGPDTMSFNAKMRGLVSEGKTFEAVKLIDELKQLKLKPDIFTFNAVIKGYCNDGKLEESKKIYVNLTKNDCAPNRGTFAILIPSFCEAGELDMALKLCNESMSRKRLIDGKLVQAVVHGLVNGSRGEEAKRLVDLARDNGYSKKVLRMPSK